MSDQTTTPARGPSVLSIRNVSKHFGGVRAVQEASLEVTRGEVVALIGPNGAGKTTLFNTVTGLIEVTGGQIVFTHDGGTCEVQGCRPDEIHRKGISRTFQNIRLFANLSALDNVKLGCHPIGKMGLFGAMFRPPWKTKEQLAIETRAMQALRLVDLCSACHLRAGSLPYGHQRRLEIARALANGPSLLLLDEPAAGMNPTETEELVALIRKVRDLGITVFLIEHDMHLVMKLSDYIYVLDHGEIIAQGKPQDVQRDPRVIEAYLGSEAAAAMKQNESASHA